MNIRLAGFCALLAGINFYSVSEADFICRADVSYLLKKEKVTEPTAHYFKGLESKGADEAAAKAGIQGQIEVEKPKAIAACKREHENEADCVAAKFTAVGSQLQGMSFSARKSLESAISNDCKARQGICQSIASPEVKCSEIVGAAPTPAEGTGNDAGKGGKDDKKKK